MNDENPPNKDPEMMRAQLRDQVCVFFWRALEQGNLSDACDTLEALKLLDANDLISASEYLP